MNSRHYYLRGNTRALLVGMSLLLMACSVGELRQSRGLEREATQALGETLAASQISPLRAEQLVAGLTLLQLGYAEQEVFDWLSQLEHQQQTLNVYQSSHRHVQPVFHAPSMHPDSRPMTDSRAQIALNIPASLSGSSPQYL